VFTRKRAAGAKTGWEKGEISARFTRKRASGRGAGVRRAGVGGGSLENGLRDDAFSGSESALFLVNLVIGSLEMDG
jgi:hypothetical protein